MAEGKINIPFGFHSNGDASNPTPAGVIIVRRGKYPPKASGDRWRHLRLIAHEINSRVVVREQRLGELRYLLERIPERITRNGEE